MAKVFCVRAFVQVGDAVVPFDAVYADQQRAEETGELLGAAYDELKVPVKVGVVNAQTLVIQHDNGWFQIRPAHLRGIAFMIGQTQSGLQAPGGAGGIFS